MRALAMVAHPDDCVIYAYGFLQAHQNLDWTICYLTYTATDDRGREISEFWQRRGITTEFLGYYDTYMDMETDCISFDTKQAATDIMSVIQNFDLVLTHDHRGDYGHIHHKFVNHIVCNNHNTVVTFATAGQGNVKYHVAPGSYNLDDLPVHQEVIMGVHPDLHVNEYFISERVAKIL
jgi:LmbE family N-acetylglucosaminyl deacetylase